MHYLHRACIPCTLVVLVLVSVAILATPVQSQQGAAGQGRASKCSLAADELESLIDSLDDIEQPLTAGSGAAQEEESAEEEEEPKTRPLNPQCTRELRMLRNSIRLLQYRYQELKQDTATVDARKYDYLKHRYALQKTDLTAKLEQLVTQANAQHRAKLNDLRRKIKAVERQLNETIERLAEQRQANVNHYIQLVANNIQRRQVETAIKNFNILMRYSTDPYGAIVTKVIELGGVQANNTLMQFLEKVNFEHQPVAGYEALVNALIARQALIGAKAIELLKHLQSLVLARDGNQQERAVALLKRFKSHVQ